MFGWFSSQDSKMRENAANWLEVAEKVWDFRRDLLTAKEGAELQARTDALRQQFKAKADAGKLKLAIEALEDVLRRTGGAIYPKSALVENIEFLLVAAIVIIGVRTFFIQPFKIPTNSMWPTFNGMTPEVFATKADEPGVLAMAARGVFYGAWPHRLDAPADGEVLIPISQKQAGVLSVDSRLVPGRTWLVIPTQVREYRLYVGESYVTVKLPVDFDFDWLISRAFFGTGTIKDHATFQRRITELYEKKQFEIRRIEGVETYCFRTGKMVKRGDRVLGFDEITGDQLFVDRISYNFVRPKVGQGFVFATRTIPELGDMYYIKRLVGTPGDVLELHPPVIYRNGSPITGSTAFDANARRQGYYRGYVYGPPYRAQFLLKAGDQVQVPEDRYFAMGDNSENSYDSRYWGFVPAKEVMGRPLFIYYPFSKHWGPSR